ncbi:hypothetical protein C8Q80DRAFT_1118870 [Daedaleopsis nitida]|nr:hypothetical protein C8Q80DRAFT_1118870 [Daedaleopsis nitida]
MDSVPSFRNSTSPTILCSFPPCAKMASHKACCSKCKLARYCQRAHQVSDAERHRSECTTTPAEFRRVKVLLFSASQTSPKVVQVNCHVRQDGENPGEELHTIDWRSLLGPNAPFTSQPVGPPEPSTLAHGPHSNGLYLAFNGCFAIDGSPVNRCAAQLTEGRSSVLWRGTLVGYRAREPASRFTQFMDVSMDDLPAFSEFLKTHGATHSAPPSPMFMRPSHRPGDIEEERDLCSYLLARMILEGIINEEDPFMPSSHPFSALPHSGSRGASSTPLRSTPTVDFARQTELVRDAIREEFAKMRVELWTLLQQEVPVQVWLSVLSFGFYVVLAYVLWTFGLPVLRFAYHAVVDWLVVPSDKDAWGPDFSGDNVRTASRSILVVILHERSAAQQLPVYKAALAGQLEQFRAVLEEAFVSTGGSWIEFVRTEGV